jgi:DHA1 family multidrug resistance protein-like MFS transporter
MSESLDTSAFSWRRNLAMLWIAQFIAMIGIYACLPFLPLYIRELGITDLAQAQKWSGLVYAGPFFVAIITVPIFGVLGDKYGRKMMIVRAIIGLTISTVLMGLVQNVEQLFLARMLQGGMSGFISAGISLIAATTPQRFSGYAMGVLQTSIASGTVIGPLIGGILSDTMGVRPLFVVVASLCALSSVIVIFFLHDVRVSPIETQRISLRDNIRMALTESDLRRVYVMIILVQTGLMMTQPILPYFLESLFAPKHLLATITGVMAGIVGVLNIIVAPLWGKRNDRKGYQEILRQTLPLTAIAIGMHCLLTRFEPMFVLRILLGIVSGAILPALYAAIGKQVRQEIRGGMMSIASSSQFVGSLAGPLVGGWIASAVSMPMVFAVSSGVFCLVYGLNWLAIRRS